MAYTHHIITIVHIAQEIIQPIVRYGWQPRLIEFVFSQEDIKSMGLIINHDVMGHLLGLLFL
jgi:hypothetical protein